MHTTASESLASLWDEIFGSQPDPDLWVVLATLAASLAVVVPNPLWRGPRNASPIAPGAGPVLVAMLVMIRNAYGALTVIVTGGTFVVVSWLPGPQVQAAFAYAVVWFLLIGGGPPAFGLHGKRRRGGAGDSDADQLARLTHAPAGLWLFLFHVVSLCALMGGAKWLL